MGEPMPVAPVVVWVIAGITVFVQTVGTADAADTEFETTVMVLPQ